jgi:Fe-S-cluster containining protein
VSSKLVSLADTDFSVSAEILEQLKQIYVDLERDLSDLRVACEGCGRCCHFASFDHELRLTQLELSYLIACHGFRRPVEDGVCPYLEQEQCGARLGRALGCRVFFCQAEKTQIEDLYQRTFFKIRELAAKNGITVIYEELLKALGEVVVSDDK